MTKILDTTLRDGSYVLNFQFSKEDTRLICRALDQFGMDYIEVGHGLGMGGGGSSGKLMCDDVDYLAAASESIQQSKWGMFFIPGVGDFKSIDIAADYDMDFIRIGTNANEYANAIQYIEYAKKKGLWVAANFMKSYAISPDEFSRNAIEIHNIGADIVSVVDSAGSMLPVDVKNYFSAVDNRIPLGFHGHNNLQLAIANSLAAIECGASVIDCSLQGLGRDAGNAATEIMLSIMIKNGWRQEQDLMGLLDFSRDVIKPMLKEPGVNDVSLISGVSQFHSAYYKTIREVAIKEKLDERELIRALKEINIINPSEQQINEAAKQVNKTNKKRLRFRSQSYRLERHEKNIVELAENIADTAKAMADKCSNPAILNIVATGSDNTFVSRYIQETDNFIVASFQVSTCEMLEAVTEKVGNMFDYVLYDIGLNNSVAKGWLPVLLKTVPLNKLMLYRDTEIWAKAVENTVLEMVDVGSKVLITGGTEPSYLLGTSLNKCGYDIKREIDQPESFDLIICFDLPDPNKLASLKSSFSKDSILIDGGIGAIPPELVAQANKVDAKVVRVDMRVALEAEIISKLGSKKLLNQDLGEITVNGIRCVAGGLYGEMGDVVIDSVHAPRCVIGIANGMGGVLYELDEQQMQTIKLVEDALFNA